MTTGRLVFGEEVSAGVAFDLDDDGTVGFDDFFIFVDNFGKTVRDLSAVWPTCGAPDGQACAASVIR